MKKTIFSLATLAMIAASCSDNTDINSPIDPNAKEMISFSMSDGASGTRAGFLGNATTLAMHIISADRTNSATAKYTNTIASAAVQASGKDYSVVTFDGAYKRFWDDAHGRKSLLSVYAVAVPNGGSSIKNNSKTLEELLNISDQSAIAPWVIAATPKNTIEWQITTSAQEKDAPTATSPSKNIDQEDLVYANNIQANTTLGKNGVYRWSYTDNKYTPDETGSETAHHAGQMLFFQNGMTDTDAATKALSDAPGHFDKGHLMFNHALSRMTITIVEGKGFDKTSTNKDNDFNFASGTNIKLLDMNVKGTLDIPTGVWTIPAKADGGIADIAKIAQTETGTYPNNYAITEHQNSKYYTLTSQMLPDYVIKDGINTNVMQFTIDNNTYFITQDMLFDALYANAGTESGKNGLPKFEANGTTPVTSYTMAQGKNYAFSITVNKTEIQAITATLADWVDVNASYSINNSHITVTTQKVNGSGDTSCREFNFYRLGQTLDKIYTDDSYTAESFSGDYKTEGRASKTETGSETNIWNTEWFYESNKIAYHFRTLNDLASGTNDANITNSSSTPAVSSFTMQSGTLSTHDYHWGAPMKSDATLAYDKDNGFKASIHKGMVAPKNNESNTINITEMHMMSNINIRLITDSIADQEHTGKYTPGPAAVNLANAEITLTRFAKTASVDMGIGLITPVYTAPSPLTHSLEGDADCAKIDAPAFTGTCWWTSTNCNKTSTDWFTYAVVPQALRRTSSATPSEADCVGLTIRTTDANEYYVIKDLATIIATTVTTNSSLGAERDQKKNEAIARWFPGHTYNYTIRITKKGIEAITCTIADWVTISAKQIDITLED